MAISLLYGCCQVETCTADLPAARSTLRDLVDAVPVEQELARQIAALLPGTGYAVDHLECGGAVFQINQPARDMTFNGQKSIHQAYLDRDGACITNLNYYVDDIGHARTLLAAMGAQVHIEGPSTAARALGDYGPDNSRPGADERPFLFMGTRHLFGFDLEIMEPNFLRIADQTTQFPAFLEPRPVPTSELRLHRLVGVVADLEQTWAAIRTCFAPASRSKPYAHRNNATGRSFRIGLGGIEIEYCQPTGLTGQFADHLAGHGPGLASVVFGCRDPGARTANDHRWQAGEAGDGRAITGLGNGACVFAASRADVGFDIVLEASEAWPVA